PPKALLPRADRDNSVAGPSHAVRVAVEHDRLEPGGDLVPVRQQRYEGPQLRDRNQVAEATSWLAAVEANLVLGEREVVAPVGAPVVLLLDATATDPRRGAPVSRAHLWEGRPVGLERSRVLISTCWSLRVDLYL